MSQEKGERRRGRDNYRRDSAVCGVDKTKPTSDGKGQEQEAQGMWFVVDSWVHTLCEACLSAPCSW